MSYSRKTLLLCVVLAVAALGIVVGGCGSSGTVGSTGSGGSTTSTGAEGTPQPGGSLVVGAGQDIQTLLPSMAVDEPSTLVLGWVYDSLFISGPDGRKAEPDLATGIKFSTDGRTATLSLRKGVKFQNGAPMTSADVAFSLRELVASPALGAVFDVIEGETPKGPYEVVLKLAHPETDLAELLATSLASIVPDNYGGESTKEFEEHPIGTGPFEFVSRKPGVEVSFKKNPHYWQPKKPYLDAITYKVFNDANALSTAFQAGNIDVVNFAPLSSLPTFGSGVVSFTNPSSQTATLAVNGRSGALADVKVREAVSHAIDRAGLVKGLLEENGTPAIGALQPAVVPPGAKGDEKAYTFDPELAKERLAESSVHGKASLSLIYSTGDSTQAAVAQALQSEMAEVGIQLNLKALDPTAAISSVLGGKFELGLVEPSASVPTASGSIGFYVLSEGYGGGWDMTEPTKVLNQYTAAKSPQQQIAAVEAFENYSGSELPSISLFNPYSAFVTQPDVGGFSVNPLLVYRVGDLWLEQ